ncbi:MAG: O-antigen ligase family protein, partial [Candidatus Omnitrophota bacterium]|nr:O-antigen ligase family protein [Candidatus Omnitrophota bacterium]
IYIIVIMALIQMFVTKYRFPEETFGSIIRISRRYFYYAMFFPALYILSDRKRAVRFFKLAIGTVILFCCIFIAQFFAGSAHKIFTWAVRIEYQMLQGFRVTRIYVYGTMTATLLFSVSLMVLLFWRSFKYELRNIVVFFITLIQILLSFGRANIFGIMIGTLFSAAVAGGRAKFRNIAGVSILLILILILTAVIFEVTLPNEDLFKAVLTRIGSIFTAITQKEDTFVGRIEDNYGRIDLVRKNPLFGVGFVHDESRLFAFARGTAEAGIRTSDSGILTLLLDLGFVGVAWLLALTFIFLRRSVYLYKMNSRNICGPIILGIIAFYFGRLFSFITLGDFVMYDGITTIVIALALLESINYNTIYERNE